MSIKWNKPLRRISSDSIYQKLWKKTRLARFEEQNGLCAICNEPVELVGAKGSATAAHLDHCHKTGQIRGILRHRHNLALGAFDDNETNMLKAIMYLKKWRKKLKI